MEFKNNIQANLIIFVEVKFPSGCSIQHPFKRPWEGREEFSVSIIDFFVENVGQISIFSQLLFCIGKSLNTPGGERGGST